MTAPVDLLASRLAVDWVASGQPNGWRSLDGTAVLADLTGFTRLTEQLLDQRGDEGVEVLSRVLHLCFGALLAPALREGGDVLGFAGDAALVWFDGDDHHRRAAAAALAMPAGLARVPATLTGGRRIRASVGAHSGEVLAVMTGEHRRALFLCGPDVSRLVGLESAAAPGQVVASEALAARLPASQRSEAVGPGVELRRPRDRRAAAPHVARLDDRPIAHDAMRSLLPPVVRPLLGDDGPRAEHRTASIGFVAVPGLDGLLAASGPDAVARLLDETVATVDAISSELGLTWFDVDVGPDAVRLLLACGAPEAVADDEARLLLALRRIVDASPHPLRAGAARGRVFVGTFGVEGRRTFSLLGDAVNTAARALGRAGDGEVVAAEGIAVERLPGATITSLGEHALKNKAAPVRLWRVDAVSDALPGAGRSGATSSLRAHERDLLTARWKAATDGSGSALRLEGSPGMGVSELLADLVDRAGAAATAVVPDASRRQVPHALVSALVRSLATQAGCGPGSDPVEWLAAHRTRLGPPVAGWVDDALDALRRRSRPDDLDPVATARRARRALAALLAEAAPSPWLLAVDDHDVADDASRAVIDELRSLASHRPWLVVTTATASDPSEVGVETLEVGPLDAAAATALLREVAPQLRPDQVARILAAAGGNPFVLTELARHPVDGELPETLERLASIGIDRLEPPVRRLVREAAVFGRTLELATVAAVLGRPELGRADAWRPALALFRVLDDERLVFRHDAYRQAAHNSLSFARRRELHGAIAEHLAAGDHPDPAVLAVHYEGAGRRREAYPLARRAAEAALASGALVEAAALLTQASGLATHVDPDATGHLLLQLAETSLRLGDLDAAAATLRRATRVVSDPVEYGLLCSHRAELDVKRGRVREARRWLRRGLEVTGPLGDSGAAAHSRLLDADVVALGYLGRHDEAVPLAREALAAAQRSGDRSRIALAHHVLEMALSAVYDPEADEHGAAAAALFAELGHQRELGTSLLNAGLTAMLTGRWDEALDRYQRSAEVSVASGDVVNTALAEMNAGFLLVRQGRVAEAHERAVRCVHVLGSVDHRWFSAYAQYLLAACAAADGRFDDAGEQLDAARATFESLVDHSMVVDCDVARVDHLLLAGRAVDAREHAVAQSSRVARASDVAVVVLHGLLLGLAIGRTGDPAAGAEHVVAALARARENHLLYEAHRCLAALLELAAAGGPPVTAEDAAEHEALARRLGLTTG